MNASSMRAAAACALLATTCLVSPALAQTAGTPSAYKNVDENGVDLTDGSFNFSLVEGSIGSGQGLLSLIRYDAGGSSLDNWEGLALRIEGGTATVSLGDRSETFTAGSAGFSADQANGATLIGSGSYYRYRNARGTEIVFASPTGSPTPDEVSFCSTAADTPCDLAARSIVEPNGKRVSLSWEVETPCDAAGTCTRGWRLFEVSNNLGYAMRVAYRPGGIVDGQITEAWFDRASVTFRNQVSTGSATPTVAYSTPAVGVTEITDAGGRTWRITTDAQNRITGIKRPGAASDSTVVTYDNSGVSQVTHGGVTTNYARTVNGNVIATVVSDALGTRHTVMSNLASGRPTQATDALGRTTLYGYDANDRLTELTAPEGNKRLTTYDPRGNVTRVIARAKPGSDGSPSLPDIITEAGYDLTCDNSAVCNQPRWAKDAVGAQTDYDYDASGNVTSVKSPAPTLNAVRPETRYTYEPLAAPLSGDITMLTAVSACQTDASCTGTANEVITKLRYSLPNLELGAIEAGAGDGSLKALTQLGYDAIGNLVTIDGPLAGPADTTRTYYNASREVIGTIGPDPDGTSNPDGTGALKHRAQRLFRNADGDVTLIHGGTAAGQTRADLDAMSALEAVHTGYDAHRRPVYQSRDEGGVVTSVAQVAYDTRGRVSCVTQRMNPARYTGALPSACELQLPNGPYGYDRRTVSSYDAADRLIERVAASGLPEETREVAATYTANGQLATLTDANDNKTSYVHDGHDRLSRTLYPVAQQGVLTSNAADFEELSYDSRSNVTRRRLRDGASIDLSYDALGRMVFKDVPPTGAFWDQDATYAYDNLGRLTRAVDGGGIAIDFSWDALGRMTREANNTYGVTSSQFDIAGRRTRLTYPRDGFYVTYDHLVTGETTRVSEGWSGQALGIFAYDDRGRRTSLTRGNGTVTTYAYDPASRLAAMDQQLAGTAADLALSFAYNPASQIVETVRSNDAYRHTPPQPGYVPFAVNGLNQLVDVGGAYPAHDAKGNMTFSPPSSGQPARTYAYTAENRLAQATVAGAAPVNMAYDTLGRLFHMSSGSEFSYDGANVIEETQGGTGARIRRFVHGPGIDEPLMQYDGGGAKTWFHADERGSIVARSDDDGNAVSVNTYDEYGVPGAGNSGRFGYTGQMWLPEIGLYSYKARMYDPKLGRFLQKDPIGFLGGANGYNYVGSDPVNFRDPLGLQQQPPQPDPNDEIVVTGTRLRKPSFCEENQWVCQLLDNTSAHSPLLDPSFILAAAEVIDICSGPLTGSANRGQSVNSRRAQVRRERRQAIAAALLTGGSFSTAYSGLIALNASRLSPNVGKWIVGGTSYADGNRLFGAVTAELGIPLQIALAFANAAEPVDDFIDKMVGNPSDNTSGGDDPEAQADIRKGSECPG